MSKQYRDLMGIDIGVNTSEAMREFCQRPGKTDENGNVQYFTEQSHLHECDVNKIIAKYDRNGLITHISKIEGKYGDVTGADFQSAQNLVINAQYMFDQLPSEIRKRFDNNPGRLLAFMENEANREEALKLGLISPETPEGIDGFGEHVKDGEIVSPEPKPATENEPAAAG